MRITALAGGVGAARFLRGVRAAAPDAQITVIGNTADDITIWGLRVCPDLDTLMYTLGGGIEEEQGWGRAQEHHVVQSELAAYGVEPQWFGLGDRDLATHIARTQMLASGQSLTEVTGLLCQRWETGVRLLPMSDDVVETHVTFQEAGGPRTVHFQEWWIRLHAAVPADRITAVGVESAQPAPGVVAAIRDADVVLLPPSNPVVSIGTVLQVPGVAEALRSTPAPVVGVSPIIDGAPVRGRADACLRAIGVDSSAAAVARHYGARSAGGLLDGWLVDPADDVSLPGLDVRAVPLWMLDLRRTTDMAVEALRLAGAVA